MEKIAGKYAVTKANIMGDKRSTMLENELQYIPETGKTKKRGYVCYPGVTYTYGLPYPPKTESVALAMQGWPGTKIWCDKGKKKKRELRDFTALNRGAMDMAMVTEPEHRAYRSVYDVRLKPTDVDSLRRAPLIFPDGMVFGLPPRPSTPIGDIIEHKFQRCFIQQQVLKYLKRSKNINSKKPPPGAYFENRVSQLRRYKEPADPAPYWHMPRFSRYAKPHLETFSWGPMEKRKAFHTNVFESIPRQAQFEVHRSGIHEPAKN